MQNWIQEHFLLLMLAAAAVITFAWLLRFRERLRMTWYSALAFSILHVLYGVSCV